MVLLKGNKLQERLQSLGYDTDGEDWDAQIEEQPNEVQY